MGIRVSSQRPCFLALWFSGAFFASVRLFWKGHHLPRRAFLSNPVMRKYWLDLSLGQREVAPETRWPAPGLIKHHQKDRVRRRTQKLGVSAKRGPSWGLCPSAAKQGFGLSSVSSYLQLQVPYPVYFVDWSHWQMASPWPRRLSLHFTKGASGQKGWWGCSITEAGSGHETLISILQASRRNVLIYCHAEAVVQWPLA